MKKVAILFLFLFGFGLLSAQDMRFTEAIRQKNKEAVYHRFFAEQLQKAVLRSETDKVKDLLKKTDKTVWLQKDRHGNNLFHLVADKETFSVLWLYLAGDRESLLMQKNKSGEIPWMSYIIYGKEDVFLSFFPKSELYQRLQDTTRALKEGGLQSDVAKINQKQLTDLCSAGGQTLWQRADLMHRGLASGMNKGFASYTSSVATAPGMGYATAPQTKMQQVRDLIEQVAPFLKH